MKKKWLAAVVAAILAVTALPVTALAEEKDDTLTKVTLNEVAHSISMRRSILQLKKDILLKRALTLLLSQALAQTKQ